MPRRYDPYNDPYSDRIGELIRARGDIAARQALESGDIWGRGIQNIAGQLGAGVQQYAEQREEKRKAEEMSKRDEVWTSYIESGAWQKDPAKAYGIARKIWGPDAGKQMEGLAAVSKMATEGRAKEDPEEDRKRLGAMFTALKGMGDPAVAKLYPSIRALMLKNYPEAEIPEQYDPSMREQYINPIAEAYGGPKKTTEVKGALVTDTGEVVYQAPPEVKTHLVTVPGPNGPMQRLATEEELAAGVPSYQKPEKREQTLAEKVAEEEALTAARARGTASVAGVAGGKPPTEGETKAAGFYDRAFKAEQVVKGLEAAGKGKPGFWESWTPDKMLPEDRRLYLQAQRDFTISHLRPESGAAISKEEYAEDAKTYFPQHGDSQAVIDQKAAARKTILDSLKAQGARALAATATPGVPKITSKADFDALPSGTEFIAPDGTRRRKP
jgi:hypothetical protein